MKGTVQVVEGEFIEVDTRTVDERKRVTLGTMIGEFTRVRVLKNSRGEILLQPIAEIPASEVWLFQNQEALDLVRTGLKESAEGKVSRVNPEEL